ncbi:pentapeptide repeat-containing protein [Legionella sp. PC997]|uniref:pentapeptide repeat-containing protein n=1 Tax=Legionella sp. PC997 TaxID=2755562 RepID=UPI0015FB9A65|nr:pentapeptide repeat-containing protein [Legionella sp. PC997]QMT61527.1 hypothetical protein HBNCFIEN_02931 [Legionella sp. PC997]
MKKLNEFQIKKIYPQMSDIGGLISIAERLAPELRKLQQFCDTYSVPNDELLNKSTELFPPKMIYILLSLKKRIDYLKEWMAFVDELYGVDALICIIVLQNGLNEIQFRNHWTAFFSMCDKMITHVVNIFNKRLSENDTSHTPKDIDERYQLIKHLYVQIINFSLKAREFILLLDDSESSDQHTLGPSLTPTNEHPFFTLPEEVKARIFSHLNTEDVLSTLLASKDLSNTAMASFAARFKKNPTQVISYLNQITAEEAYDFVEGYRCTTEYKSLKSLIEHNMPMSDQEVACYMLTRHDSHLPNIEQLRTICTATSLDEKTRTHLQILFQNTLEVDIASQAGCLPKNPEKMNALFELFLTNYLNSYLNLLPSIDFDQVNLVGIDLSHAPLSHKQMVRMDMSATRLCGTNLSYANLESSTLKKANLQHANLHHTKLVKVCLDNAFLQQANLNHADLRYTTLCKTILKQANLRWANLCGAKLDGTVIEGADFTGTNLAYAQLINLDMRTVNLSQFNVEWTYLRNVRVVPDAALEHVEALEEFFKSFEKNLEHHSHGSQMKWRIQMIKDLKRLMCSLSQSQETYLLFLKKILAHYPPETFTSTIFSKKHPFKQLFERSQLLEVDHEIEEVELPLQAEMISILDKLQERIDHLTPDTPIRFKKLRNNFYNCVTKVPDITNVNQICRFSTHHFFLLQLFYFIGTNQKKLFKPYLVSYPQDNLKAMHHSQRYASQIFDGELFDLRKLQTIHPEELDHYLYNEEDFIIKHSGRNLNRVKLGGLFISYVPGGKGSCLSKVEIIDYENRCLTSGFTIDSSRYSALKTELYLPLNVFDDKATTVECNLYSDEISAIQAALELRANITQFIFATQKGPVPELIPITRIAPLSEDKKTKSPSSIENAEHLLLGENPFGLYHQKPKKPHSKVAEKMLCVLM